MVVSSSRAFDGLAGSFERALVAVGVADAHVRKAGLLHDGAQVGKVQVDEAGLGNEVGNALNALAQHVVCHFEGVHQRRPAHDRQQALVGDDDQGIHRFLELGNALFGVLHPAAALKAEGLGDHADGEDAELARALRDDGRSARAGAAAHAGGDEHQVAAAQRFHQLIAALFGGLHADLGQGAGAQALGDLFADLDLLVGLGEVKRLLVGIDSDELHARKAVLDHAVDRVVSRAADTDDFDLGELAHFDFKFQHCLPPIIS